MKQYRIAIVGATGMVGRTFLKVLEEFSLPVSKYTLFASQRSAGSKVDFMGKKYTVELLTEQCFEQGFDIALFSAGGSISEIYAPIAAKSGCVVIDNSAFWRMDKDVPLVVPEVNPAALKNHKGIIANPNCSTIQAMLPLKVLLDNYGIKRVIYSTYQAVSGAGVKGCDDLTSGMYAFANDTDYALSKFPYPIINNCIPHIDVFLENGYTKEEYKMIAETRKILGDDKLRVTATTVRVPVLNGHSESINIELDKPFELETVKKQFGEMSGLVVVDDVSKAKYPLATEADGKNEVFVGRIRRDESAENALNIWVVADNIRKGAATNAVQIAKYMIENELL